MPTATTEETIAKKDTITHVAITYIWIGDHPNLVEFFSYTTRQ